MNEREINLNIQRYDLDDDTPQNIQLSIKLNINSNTEEIWKQLTSALNLNNKKIIKLRLKDNTLVPVSFLLDTNYDDFIVEVTEVHQNLKAQSRSHLKMVYLDAAKSKINFMDKRLNKLEPLIPQARLRAEVQCERTINELSTKISFIERRIDQLSPHTWKTKLTTVNG